MKTLVRERWPAALTLVALLVAMEVAVRVLELWPTVLRSPSQILVEIGEQPRLYWDESLVTISEVLIGFALSIALGLVLAIGIAYSTFLQATLYPLVLLLQIVPKVAIAPLLVIFMGFGMAPKILIVVLVAFFPIVISTVAGFKQAESDMVDLVRSLNGSRLQQFTRVRLPNALPFVFSGLKVAITLAVIGAIIGELVGSNSGLGYLMNLANSNLQIEMAYAAVTLLSLIGLLLYGAVALAEKLLVPWAEPDNERSVR